MNKVLSISLSLLIFGCSIQDLVVFTYFKIDQSFIISAFCINKDKPSIKCEGKCYLAQKIEANHEEDENRMLLIQKEWNKLHFCLDQINYPAKPELKKVQSIKYTNKLVSRLLITELLHPPQSPNLIT